MKINIKKIALFSIMAVALASSPSISRAQDASTNAPAAAPAKKHSNVLHGKVASVDANAMTFTVGESTLTITSQTKITKDGQPAVFADITVGATVACAYKKDDAGKMTASTVRIGEKKKKSAPANGGSASTNAPAQ